MARYRNDSRRGRSSAYRRATLDRRSTYDQNGTPRNTLKPNAIAQHVRYTHSPHVLQNQIPTTAMAAIASKP